MLLITQIVSKQVYIIKYENSVNNAEGDIQYSAEGGSS